MKRSLRLQMSISYIVMALVLVAAISVAINYLFQSQFENYIMSQQQQRNQTLVKQLENQYAAADHSWDVSAVQNIGIEALEQGVIVKVSNALGHTVWDATVHNNGMCVQMLQDIARNMQEYNANFKGGYVQSDYPIVVDSKEVGRLTAGYFGPYYFTDNDIFFLNSINRVLIAVAAFSLVAAFLLATYMSRRISRPISKAVTAAGEIAKGNYDLRMEETSQTTEIKNLTDTINNLAGSLEKQQSLRKQMAADVAHELRTPLANLQSTLEAMIDGIWDPDSERLQSCHEEILRISRLVGELEKLERLEAENAVLNFIEFNLSDLIRRIVKNFEPEFHNKNVSLTFSGDGIIVTADKDKISQVMVNLVSNALKYTPPGGEVSVLLARSDQNAEITIQDNGTGIHEDDLPFIFERFYRADKSRNRLTGGLGLGLTISKVIVEAHGGSISVASTAGKGAAFTVLLPIKQ